MLAERVEQLRGEYVEQYVAIDGERPELSRFADMVGQVKAISFNGRALVEFEGNGSRARHDIGLDYLKVVDKPAPPAAKAKPVAKKAEPKPAPAPATQEPGAGESAEAKPDAKLSPLEVARMKKEDGADEKK